MTPSSDVSGGDNPGVRLFRWLGSALVGVILVTGARECGEQTGRHRGEIQSGERCEKLAQAGRVLVAAWDDLQAVYVEALPEVMAATLDAEGRGGWPDMVDLLAAAGVDQASYARAYDVEKASDAETRVTTAVLANDGVAARAALDDWMAVILDALEAAGGSSARERGAAILDASVTVAKRTTFAHPDAERARKAEVAAREAYAKALEAALLADLERTDRCIDCVAWRQAADALFSAVVPDPQLGEDAVAAARLCFGDPSREAGKTQSP
ncbi:MAG: hypothetical protein OXQ32_00185 [bacterium]|nr:hypothetical protein [bacterium]